MMLLDLSSAFDTIDHNTLLSVLSSMFFISGQWSGACLHVSIISHRQISSFYHQFHAHTLRLFLSMLVFPKVLVSAPLSSLPTLKAPPISFPCTISNIICSLMTLSLKAIVQFLILLTSSSASTRINVLRILLDPTPLFALVWYPCLTLQNSVTIPWAHGCRYHCSVFQFRSWPGRHSGQWAADETSREQGGEHLLLPSSTAIPTPRLCQEERYVTPCDITHTDTHRQL